MADIAVRGERGDRLLLSTIQVSNKMLSTVEPSSQDYNNCCCAAGGSRWPVKLPQRKRRP